MISNTASCFLNVFVQNSENVTKQRMTGLKIQPGSVHMFEHLNFVVVLIKPWELDGVQVEGGWCSQVRLGTRRKGIQTWKGDDITSLRVRD